MRPGTATVVPLTAGMGRMDHLEPYAKWLRSWGASTATVRTRMFTAQAFAHEHDPATVTAEDIGAWLSRWSGWTLHTYHSSLRSLYEWMTATGRRADNPMDGMRRPRRPRPEPRPLTGEEVAAILSDASDRTRALVTLALYAGLRASEAATVSGEDVTRDWIFVTGKGGQRAHLPTHRQVWALAETMPRSGFWFPDGEGGHVTSQAVSAAVGRQMRRHGIAGSLHRCRHTYATSLLRSGTNIRIVQELMRHSSITSTEAYTAVSDAERASAVAALDFAA